MSALRWRNSGTEARTYQPKNCALRCSAIAHSSIVCLVHNISGVALIELRRQKKLLFELGERGTDSLFKTEAVSGVAVEHPRDLPVPVTHCTMSRERLPNGTAVRHSAGCRSHTIDSIWIYGRMTIATRQTFAARQRSSTEDFHDCNSKRPYPLKSSSKPHHCSSSGGSDSLTRFSVRILPEPRVPGKDRE